MAQNETTQSAGESTVAELDEGTEAPTAAEARLLEAMEMPGAHRKTVGEICASAGVSRRTYYRLVENPSFAARARTLHKMLLEVVGVYQRSEHPRADETKHLGNGATPEERVRHCVNYCIPIQAWPPSLRECLEWWRDGGQEKRPVDFDQLNKLVRERCECWVETTPLAYSATTLSMPENRGALRPS